MAGSNDSSSGYDENQSLSPSGSTTPPSSDSIPAHSSAPSSDSDPAVGLKRQAGKAIQSHGKKAKQTPASTSGGLTKKPLFQRVFTDEDAVVILQGMVDFRDNNNCDPITKIDQFFTFIKELLSFDVSKDQLLNKMKKMKGNYKKIAFKKKEGLDPKILKPNLYSLSKKMWGVMDVENNNGDIGSSRAANGIVGYSSYLGERLLIQEIQNIDDDKKRELNHKLADIHLKELEVNVKRWCYLTEKARLIIAARKTNI